MWKKEMSEDEIENYFSDIYETKNRSVIYRSEFGEIYQTETCDIYESYGHVLRSSYEDFINSIEDSIFKTSEELIHYLIENFDEKQYYENDGLPLMQEVHNQELETHSDYKRGYTKYLFVYELDYSKFDLTTPKNKKDRIYLGVTYTRNNWGETTSFSIKQVEPHDKKIVVREWIPK